MEKPWICGPSGKTLRPYNVHKRDLFYFRIITYVLLCGYSPFRSEDAKELVRETTLGKIEFHEQYWKNVSNEGRCYRFISNSIQLLKILLAKDFIKRLLNVDPSKRPTADEATKDPVRPS